MVTPLPIARRSLSWTQVLVTITLLVTMPFTTANGTDVAGEQVLTSIAQVTEQYGRTDVDRLPVELDARVNYWDARDRYAFIEDEHDAAFVSIPASVFQAYPKLAPSVWVRVTGELRMDGNFILAHKVQVVRQSDMLIAKNLLIQDLTMGEWWSHRIRTTGVVREVSQVGTLWSAAMTSGSATYLLHRFDETARKENWSRRIGQEVRLLGTLTCDIDHNGQPYRYVVRMNEFDPDLRPANKGESELPVQPPVTDANIATLRKAPVSKRPYRLSGQITSAVDHEGYLIESDSLGIYVRSDLASSDLLGHSVDVTVAKDGVQRYHCIFLRSNGFNSLLPAPTLKAGAVDVATLPQRATIEAEVFTARSPGDKRIVYLRDGDVEFAACLNADARAWNELRIDGIRKLAVSGLVIPPPTHLDVISGDTSIDFVVEVGDLDDVEVITRWWQFSPSFAIASLSILTAACALGMVCFLFLWLKVQRAERTNSRLATQLMQSQKMDALGRLAGGVAHDFNNLLAGIGSNLELIKLKGAYASPEEQQCLTSARRCADQATKLVRSLLGFSRQEQLEVELGDINQAVEDSVLLATSSFGPDVAFELDLDPDVSRCRFDQSQLEQVLLNLFFNARDALDRKTGVIDVHTREWQDEHGVSFVSIRVRDRGHGMSPEILARVFEPFYTTKGVGEGTGLGLALAYGIVTQHGGRIECESEVAKGSVFTVILPAVADDSPSKIGSVDVLQDAETRHRFDAPHQAETVASANPVRSWHVLLVDDDHEVRRAAKMSLEALGHRVTDFPGGQLAVDELREGFRPDVVILDLVMPNPDGRETLRLIKTIEPDLPVVVCSGLSTEMENLQKAMPFRPDARLSKPFQLADLQNVLRLVITAETHAH